MSGAEIRRVAVGPDTTIVVRILGEGSTVAMIPSWARGASDFDSLAGSLAGAGYRALAINPRGIEGSSGPLGGLTTWDAADDVAAAIEAFGKAPVFVLGHAGGNRVARALATRRPDLVRGVVLLAAGGLHRDEARFSLFARETMFAEPTREIFIKVMHASGFFAAASDPSVWLDGWWRSTAHPQAEANRAVDPKAWWAGGGKPMLVVQGLEDGIAPPANGRDLAALYADRVRLVEIENAAHALLPEQPKAIARAVIEWLESHGG